MTDFKRLKVWEKAHEVAVECHKLAKAMRSQLYSPLQNQLVRAAASVPTNIAEGSRQVSRKDFARFLRYAVNSNTELEYQIILARDIDAIHSRRPRLCFRLSRKSEKCSTAFCVGSHLLSAGQPTQKTSSKAANSGLSTLHPAHLWFAVRSPT